MSDFVLSDDQTYWSRRRRQRLGPRLLEKLLRESKGVCALSGVPLVFDLAARTPERQGRGCHPLSPAVDHVDPGNRDGGYQLTCYALNDLKGHLPVDCFRALQATEAWTRLMNAWRDQAARDPNDREAFQRL